MDAAFRRCRSQESQQPAVFRRDTRGHFLTILEVRTRHTSPYLTGKLLFNDYKIYPLFSSFAFMRLTVMTESYSRYRDDEMFLQEHFRTQQNWARLA